MQKIQFLFTLLAVTLFLGCSNAVKVSGTVKLKDGAPLTKGSISFDNGKNSVYSPIDAEGKFELYQSAPGDHVPPGTYRGKIGYGPPPPPLQRGKKHPSQLLPFPAKYKNFESSGLTLTVEPGKEQVLDIVLE